MYSPAFFLGADTYAKEKLITIAATSVPYTLAHASSMLLKEVILDSNIVSKA
jgi:hypothetical protein